MFVMRLFTDLRKCVLNHLEAVDLLALSCVVLFVMMRLSLKLFYTFC